MPDIWLETVPIVNAELTGAEVTNVVQDVLLPVSALAMPLIANMNPSCRNFLAVFLTQDRVTASRIIRVDTRTGLKITLACRHGNALLLEAQLPGPVTVMITMAALAALPHGLLDAVLVDPPLEATTMDTGPADTRLLLPLPVVLLPGSKPLRHLHLAGRTTVVMVDMPGTLTLLPDTLLHRAWHPTILVLELPLRLLLGMRLPHRSVSVTSFRDIDTNENSRLATFLLRPRECNVADVQEIRLT
jgi:hypothetical protein